LKNAVIIPLTQGNVVLANASMFNQGFPSRWWYLRECTAHSKRNWGVAVTSAVIALYSLAAEIWPFIEAPLPAFTFSLPKLPLSWAAIIVLAGIIFILIEGGVRLLAKERAEAANRIADMEERFAPKLRIEKLHRREFITRGGINGVEYYFDLRNSSNGTSLDSVSVTLTAMTPDPLSYLPAHLHLKHDNPPPHASEFTYTTEFSLNPNDHKQIDLLTGPIPGSIHPVYVIVVIGADIGATIPKDTYKFFVKATGQNTAAVESTFEAWIDDTGGLVCSQLN
jgi:hypothetical protein